MLFIYIIIKNLIHSEMQEQSNFQQQVNKYEYMSHWKSLESVSKTLNQYKFVKLKKFKTQNFAKKDELTLAHLFLQQLYLFLYAIENKIELKYSSNFYQDRNGLIYKIYYLYRRGNSKNNLKGIHFTELSDREYQQSFKQILSPCDQIMKIIREQCLDERQNSQYPQNQYQHWQNKIRTIIPEQLSFQDVDEQKLKEIIRQLQKILLVQHYGFNIKLKNSLLMNHFFTVDEQQQSKNQSIIQIYKSLVEAQLSLLRKIQQKKSEVDKFIQQYQKLNQKVQKFYSYLQKIEKIVEFKLNTTNKQNQKQKTQNSSKQLQIGGNFLIILSPSRGKPAINEQMMQNSEQNNTKNIKKIQIKAQNSISPVSGHVLNVKFQWYIDLNNMNYPVLKISCYNNRKIEQLSYQEAEIFWNKLQSSEKFQDIAWQDKYSMKLNTTTNNKESQKMQVKFENSIPQCPLSLAIKQIDKIVAFTIAMDEVIQICERKEQQSTFKVEDFMVEHTIQRFRKALDQIQHNVQLIKKIKHNKY